MGCEYASLSVSPQRFRPRRRLPTIDGSSRAGACVRTTKQNVRERVQPVDMTQIPKILLAIAAGGALGALGRSGLSVWVGRWAPPTFPWGTLIVNVTGSLFLGVVLRLLDGMAATSAWRAFLTVGVAGAFTTFSTFSLENVQLLQEREYGRAALYMSSSVVLGICALLLGLALADQLVQRP
jgi:fluoride exporter